MSNIIQFFYGEIPANNNQDYFIENILTIWSDYKLETRHDFIQWLFPSKEPSKYSKVPILTDKDSLIIKKDEYIKNIVHKSFMRMMFFYGYSYENNSLVRYRDIDYKVKNTYIGLMSEHNYLRITRILSFLHDHNFDYLSNLFFLALCKDYHKFLKFKIKVDEKQAMKYWLQIQEYININNITDKDLIAGNSINLDGEDIKIIYSDVPSLYYKSNNSNIIKEITLENNSVIVNNQLSNILNINLYPEFYDSPGYKGLNNFSNSCYMDSVLFCLFAQPPKIIIQNFLEKNIQTLEENNKIVKCAKNVRYYLQRELVNIAKKLRYGSDNSTCVEFRKLLKHCQTSQKFYDENTQDAGEFLQSLFGIFEVETSNIIRESYVVEGNVKIKASTIYDIDTPIVSVVERDIQENVNLNSFLNKIEIYNLDQDNYFKHNNKFYDTRIEHSKLSFSKYVVFYLHRGMIGRVNNNRVEVPHVISVNGSVLVLRSVVIHRGIHYTAYVSISDVWYYYDDLRTELTQVTNNYDELIRNSNIETHGTLYFYY